MSLIESNDILKNICSHAYYRGDEIFRAIQCLAEGKTISCVRTLEDSGKTAIDEKLKDRLMKSKDKGNAFDDVNWAWLLPLLLFLSTLEPPKRREITISAKSNGKSVVITYDPSDAEAVKAAEAWRKTLFDAARWEHEEPVVVRPRDTVKFEPHKKTNADKAGSPDALMEAVKGGNLYLHKVENPEPGKTYFHMGFEKGGFDCLSPVVYLGNAKFHDCAGDFDGYATCGYWEFVPIDTSNAETRGGVCKAVTTKPKNGNCIYVSDKVRYALDAIAYLSGNVKRQYTFIPLTAKQREAIDALYEDLHSREPLDAANLFKPGSYVPKDLPTEPNRMVELEKASKPLRAYLKAHGDPHTSVIVTQDGATVKQDERGVKFRDDELLKRVKNAPLTADGTTTTQPEPEPDVLEFDRLRGELVDPLPFDVIGLWGKVAEEFLKAHEQARAAWEEGKRARIKHSMIDALESLSKRLSADLEKAIGAKHEPAKPDKNGGEMTAAEHLKFVCDGLKAEPRCNIMDIAGSAFELRNLAKPLLAYLDKYGCDEYTGVTVTRDAVIVGKTPHTDALLFEAKFPKSENPVSLKHGTWQETLLRILDTHMARRNSLNVPLQVALPSEVVVSLRNWLLGNAT